MRPSERSLTASWLGSANEKRLEQSLPACEAEYPYCDGSLGTKGKDESSKNDRLSTFETAKSVCSTVSNQALTLTAIVANDEVDLRIELHFQEFVTHEVLEAVFANV